MMYLTSLIWLIQLMMARFSSLHQGAYHLWLNQFFLIYLGDDAFALKANFNKAYPQKVNINLGYTYRHGYARKLSEFIWNSR